MKGIFRSASALGLVLGVISVPAYSLSFDLTEELSNYCGNSNLPGSPTYPNYGDYWCVYDTNTPWHNSDIDAYGNDEEGNPVPGADGIRDIYQSVGTVYLEYDLGTPPEGYRYELTSPATLALTLTGDLDSDPQPPVGSELVGTPIAPAGGDGHYDPEWMEVSIDGQLVGRILDGDTNNDPFGLPNNDYGYLWHHGNGPMVNGLPSVSGTATLDPDIINNAIADGKVRVGFRLGWDSGDLTGHSSYTTAEELIRGTLKLNAVLVPVANGNMAPEASFTYTLNSGEEQTTMLFNAGASIDSDGSIAAYEWNFGDDTTATGETVSHTYQQAGTYIVTLTVRDNVGDTSSKQLSITITGTANAVPQVDFSYTVIAGENDAEVSFSSLATDDDGEISSYLWTFGDGNTSILPNPAHSYSQSGSYSVSLQVTDNQGADSTATRIVEVTLLPSSGTGENIAPIAVASAAPNQGNAPLTVSFDASGSSDEDGGDVTYLWDFGDQSSSTQATVEHTYSNAGTYTVTLTVTDADSATDQVTLTVVVTAAPAVTGDITLEPIDDIGANRDGSSSIMHVSTWDHGFLKFDLSSISDTFESAILRVYYVGKTAQSLTAWSGASDAWTESVGPPEKVGFSWSSGTPLITVEVPAEDGYVDLDITSFVASEKAGDGIVTVELSSNNGGWKRYESKEGGHRPQLLVSGNIGAPDVEPGNEPPVAALTASVSSGQAPLEIVFDASGSTDTDGNIASYTWTFGDGGDPVTGDATMSHTFATEGNFEVQVTVTDDDGATSASSHTVNITPPDVNQRPVAVLNASATTGPAPAIIAFDASASTDSDGSIVGYTWNFGDGSDLVSGGAVFNHTFTNPGSYEVQVTVTDDDGATASSTRTVNITAAVVNQAPVAILTASATTGLAPVAIVFDASGSTDGDGNVVSYTWSFGDGGDPVTGDATISHTFLMAGSFDVQVTVTDDDGASSTTSRSVNISAAAVNQVPVSVITASSISGVAPLTVSLSASSSSDVDGEITGWQWAVNGVGFDTLASTNYTFEEAGEYVISLAVTDDAGAANVSTQTISVTPPANSGETRSLTPVADIGANRVGSLTYLNASFWDPAFLKFDLAGINSTVAKATLVLQQESTSTIITRAWLGSSDNWTEAGPPPAKTSLPWLNGTQVGQSLPSTAGSVELDVTAAFNSNAVSDGILTLEISTDQSGWKRFTSREGNVPPKLVIEY